MKKLLYFTVLKEELLKRILSGFKLGWSIAMIYSYNTRIPDSITSLSGLVFWMWIWNSAKVPRLHIPPPVLCLTVARGCNSEWCLLLCGHVLDIRYTFQVLLEDCIILSWSFDCTLLSGEIIFEISSFISHIHCIHFLKHVPTHYTYIQTCPTTLF